MNFVHPTSNFTQSNMGNSQSFVYQKDKYGAKFGFGLFMPVLICWFLIALVTGLFDKEAGIIIFCALAVLLPIGITWLTNYTRKDGSFTLTNQEVIIDGKKYDKSQVRRLAIIAHKGQVARERKVQNGVVIIAGPAIPATAAMLGHHGVNAGAEILDKFVKLIDESVKAVNYKITFQYGNKEVVLANGLSEKNALNLFDHIVSQFS